MTKKSFFYWIIFIIVNIVNMLIKYRFTDPFASQLEENKQKNFLVVDYVDYDKQKHFNDVDNLLEEYKFWLFHGDFKKGECPLYPNFNTKMHASDFDSAMNVPYYIKVAIVDNKCVGFITYYISENLQAKNNEFKKIGRIHLLSVDKQYRRLGIANKFITDCMNFFKLNNCQRIYLITRPENIRAKGLYYKFGFTEIKKDKSIDLDVFDRDPADILVKDL